MIEKRFELREQLNKNIQCDEISDNGEWITYGEIVDLLNELVDKNEQLQKDNNELENEIEKLESKLWNCQNVR